MGRVLRLLIIEDVEDHALLMVRELQKGGFDPEHQRVETLQELEAALDTRPWDAIFSDFNLPGFDGIDVLHMVQQKDLDLPFLLISGAIGEEKAAEVMKAGAHDYIRKGNYARLVPTLERELRDAKIRQERRKTAEELTRYREHLEELVQVRTAELEKQKQEREEALLKLEAVLEGIKEGVVISDLQGNVLTMNKEALALSDFESMEQARCHLSEYEHIFEVLDLAGHTLPYEGWPLVRAMSGEHFTDSVYQIRRKDTGKSWIGSYSGTPICNQAGDDCLAVVTFRDVTERTQWEDALRKSEMKFAKIFNSAPTMMGITSLHEGRVIDVNETTLQTLGYDREEVIGRTTRELGLWVDEADRERVLKTLEESEAIRNMEITFKGKYGKMFIGLFSAETIDIDNDRYLLSLVRDITEWKHAEEALIRAKTEWERTFDSVPDLIAIIDEQQRIVRVNLAMAERLGRQPDECIGLLCYTAIHGADSEPKYCPHAKTVADQQQHEAVVLEHHLNGQFMVTTTPLAANGSLRGTVYVARDISERIRAEQEITKLNENLSARVSELEERNQELDAFNRMVSHDLRQPLNNMGLAYQSIAIFCQDQDENCKEAIKIVEKGVKSMNAMIETLLNFARSTHGDLNREDFDISNMARIVVEELRSSDPNRRVNFQITEGIMANGDPKFIKIVLDNLIGNAWKYTGSQEESLIEFGTERISGTKAYYVRDNGMGFDMADAGKLFLPFQRLPRTSGFKGSGIGLATVSRIIKRHNGQVWAEGERDRGATFYFTLEGEPEVSAEKEKSTT